MHKAQQQVGSFHREVLNGPTFPVEPMIRDGVLRARLIIEEAIETAFALVGYATAPTIVQDELLKVTLAKARAKQTAPDLVEAIDGCIDTLYVVYGTLEAIGVDAEPFFDEVHRANMAKKDGPIDENGKKGKPKDWQPPDIAGVLRDHFGGSK